jgi:two-component system sensor histidine kinase RegB
MKTLSLDFKRLAAEFAGTVGAGARRAGALLYGLVVAFTSRRASVTRLRLQTLLVLRWIAIIGQCIAILVVELALHHKVPILACGVPIAASFGLNLVLSLIYPTSKRLSEQEAALHMAWDVLQLSVLLYFTGGLLNPFSILLLAPPTIAAGTLTRRSVVLLVLLSLTCATVLGGFGWHWPLPWPPEQDFAVPRIYEFGEYCALVLALVFSTMFVWRISAEQNRMSDALAATEMVLAREQLLSAVGGLAAAAAHELGSPLATISVVARELEREINGEGPLAKDVALLRSQTERCRGILHRLTLDAAEVAAEPTDVPLRALLEEIAAPHRGFGIEIHIEIKETPDMAENAVAQQEFPRRPEILHGLGNIIENAVDFARTRVVVAADLDQQFIRIRISDDGPGFPREILDHLGEPFLASGLMRLHPGETPGGTTAASIEDAHGMGLGFFIAKTLLERTGAKVSAHNIGSEQKAIGQGLGARVTITWARQDLAAFVSGIKPAASRVSSLL